MSRRQALKNLGMALLWMPIYIFILAPAIFAIVVILSIFNFLLALVTDRPFTLTPERAIDIWYWTEDNTTSLMGADEEFSWRPP